MCGEGVQGVRVFGTQYKDWQNTKTTRRAGVYNPNRRIVVGPSFDLSKFTGVDPCREHLYIMYNSKENTYELHEVDEINAHDKFIVSYRVDTENHTCKPLDFCLDALEKYGEVTKAAERLIKYLKYYLIEHKIISEDNNAAEKVQK